VSDVEVTQPSGNTTFDENAKAAVWKSSPFRVPTDREMFKEFKSFPLTFKATDF